MRDVQYDRSLPNGYLDIYYPADMANSKPLTVIYIHGGGYIWGDKASGDPNAGNNAFDASLTYQLVDAGYPVISMNYALAPEYRWIGYVIAGLVTIGCLFGFINWAKKVKRVEC